MVDNGVKIAEFFNVPERIIGLTIIALGTSLPELVTTVTAIAKREYGMSVGKYTGSQCPQHSHDPSSMLSHIKGGYDHTCHTGGITCGSNSSVHRHSRGDFAVVYSCGSRCAEKKAEQMARISVPGNLPGIYIFPVVLLIPIPCLYKPLKTDKDITAF